MMYIIFYILLKIEGLHVLIYNIEVETDTVMCFSQNSENKKKDKEKNFMPLTFRYNENLKN